MMCIILSLRKRMKKIMKKNNEKKNNEKNNEKRMKKRDLKNFLAYIKYQCGHGVSLDDALKNLGYVRIDV